MQEKLNEIKSLQEQGGEDAIKKIQEIKEEAEAGFEGGVAGAAEKAIAEMSGAEKVATEGMQAEVQTAAVSAETMGGRAEEVREVSEPIQVEVKAVVEEGKKEISEISTKHQEPISAERQKLEILTNELNSISEKVKADWEKYLQSGEIEKSNLFIAAKVALNNMTPYSHEKRQPTNTEVGNTTYIAKPNPGAEAWREVAQKISDLKDNIRAKAQEILKPLYDFREKVKLSGLVNEEAKELDSLSMGTENFVIRDNYSTSVNELQKVYKDKIGEYNKIIETRF